MKIKVLASGSKGNAVYLESFSAKILIDCGISFKRLLEKMNISHKNDLRLDACFITHEHIDHVSGLNMFVKNMDTMIYTSKGTKSAVNQKYKNILVGNSLEINNLESLFINNLKITPFLISHDAREPYGYIFEEDNEKIVFLTDSGYLDHKYFEILSNANLYYFESNHDVEMLINSTRPHFLKERILSDYGHLSNIDSAINFIKICGMNTKKIILAHLSDECNSYECARRTYEEVFLEHQFEQAIEIYIANQNDVLEVICD